MLNARNAMRDRGGRLTLAIAPAEAGGYVALQVQDTGCGIPPEHLDKIFDPFFTTRPKSGGNGKTQDGGGTGLGLPVARDLVRQAGGEIHVQSTPGAGSTFTVLLPVVE
jgi:signal transduction histidine kinase